MEKELSAILESIDSELFTDDVKNQVIQVFESAVNKTVAERVALEIESALKTQDEEYTAKLKTFAEAIDIDHTQKAEKMCQKLSEDFIKKTKVLVEKYDNILKDKAVKTQTQLVESVNDFLDQYIEKTLPKAKIEEAARNKYHSKILSEARQILGIDPSLLKENVKTAIKDGKNKMNQLVQEKQKLAQENENMKKGHLLAEATFNLPKDKARFIVTRLKDKPLDFVKSNLKFVSEMYDRSNDNNQRRSALQTKPVGNIVDRNKVAGELINENVEGQSQSFNDINPDVAMYMEGLTFKR